MARRIRGSGQRKTGTIIAHERYHIYSDNAITRLYDICYNTGTHTYYYLSSMWVSKIIIVLPAHLSPAVSRKNVAIIGVLFHQLPDLA